MNRTTTRWTIAMAAAAVFSLPVSGLAQTPAPAQPPATAQEPAPAPPAPQQSPAADAVKAHVTAARNTLSELTQLPAASQLQGEARANVSQLINNFNEMITTKVDWKAAHAKVEANLAALLGPQPAPDEPPRTTGTAGAVGTSGTATASLDPAIRAKLIEFRDHLEKFEAAAGGGASTTPDPAAATSTTTTSTTTTTATTTAPPATPTPQQPPANQPSEPAQQPDAAPASPDELLRHVDAIEAILGAQAAAQSTAQTTAGGAVGTSGTASGSTRTTITGADVRLSPDQIDQLRTHLAELRRLIGDRK